MAVQMFTDLKMWEEAKHWADQGEKNGTKLITLDDREDEAGGGAMDTNQGLLLKQAASSEEDGDLRSAGEIYYRAAGDMANQGEVKAAAEKYKLAADLFMKTGAVDALMEVVRVVDPNSDKNHMIILQNAVKCFRKLNHFLYAKETLLKLDAIGELISLFMESQRWEEAFHLSQQHPQYAAQIHLPWAEWLVRNDRFEEAKEAYAKAGRTDLALKMLKTLTGNSVQQKRYREAANRTWNLAVETMRGLPADCTPAQVPQSMLEYETLCRTANLYYAYSFIQDYIEEPFTTMMPEQVFHIALYLWNVLSSSTPMDAAKGIQPGKNQAPKEVPLGVSRMYILFALAKQAQNLGAFKLARTAFSRTEHLVVPALWQPQIDLACLGLRSKPYSDSEELMSVCNRCMATNPLLRTNNDACTNCSHPFIRTFLGFEVLPLVEFAPEIDIMQNEVLDLIKREPSRRGGGGGDPGDGWREGRQGGADTLMMDTPVEDEQTDLFVQRVLDAASCILPGAPYQVVRVDRETLADIPPEEVFIVDYSRFSPFLPTKYYRSMIPDIPVTLCKECGQFFHQETWELEYLKTGKCPYCEAVDCEWSLLDFEFVKRNDAAA